MLERIVQARSDLSKADSRDVMLECREVFATKHSNDTSEAPLPAKGKNTTTPFKVALAAAKKKPGSGDQALGSKGGSKSGDKAPGAASVAMLPKAAVQAPKPQEPVMISGIPKLEMMS